MPACNGSSICWKSALASATGVYAWPQLSRPLELLSTNCTTWLRIPASITVRVTGKLFATIMPRRLPTTSS